MLTLNELAQIAAEVESGELTKEKILDGIAQAQKGEDMRKYLYAALFMYTGGGTYDHTELTNRDAEAQHPMSAIEGLLELIYEGRSMTNTKPEIMTKFSGGITKISTFTDLPNNSWVSSTGKNFKSDTINRLGDNFPFELSQTRSYKLSRHDWSGENSSVYKLEGVSAVDSYHAYYSGSKGGYVWVNTSPGEFGLDPIKQLIEDISEEIDELSVSDNDINKRIDSVNDRVDAVSAARTDIFEIPAKWHFDGEEFVSSPFAVPESGFSVRTPSIEISIKGEAAAMCFRVFIGTVENDAFIIDGSFSDDYCIDHFSRKMFYVPPLEGKYAVVYYKAIGDSDNLLDSSNYEQYAYLLDNLKIYSGSVHGGGELLGVRPVNIEPKSTDEKYSFNWGISGKIHKYQTLASPLPLKYAKSVSCTPDMWIGGKVYRFDPVNRTTKLVETLCFGEFYPIWGYECSLDFSKYDDDCFALLTFGKVPQKSEYENEIFDGKSYEIANNATLIGFDMTDYEKKIRVEWVKNMQISHDISGGSPVVQRNINLLKSLRHKTVTGMYPRGTTNFHYIFGVENLAGAFYGGSYQTGTFFYNVSPASYYTALLNPNSNAYKNEDLGSGIYGIVCAPFVSLLHGHSIPQSTFDMRYNKHMKAFTPEKFDFEKQLHTVRRYDILTLGDGHTGHCVAVGDVFDIDGEYGAMRVLESTHPTTGESLFWLHNSLPYYKGNPEEWYQANYSFICRTDPAYDSSLHDKANWVPKYTAPQKVMCNRGYGSVYLTSTPVYISAALDVTSIDVYVNGVLKSSRDISDMEYEERWGYNLIDISDLVNEGEVTVRNDIDNSEETFYVFNPAGYSVTASLEGEWLTVHTNRPEEAKYINVIVAAEPDTYIAEDAASMNYAPEFDENGDMRINTRHVTEEIGTWSLAARPNLLTSVRVVFKTPYDTNTFCVDAAGNVTI